MTIVEHGDPHVYQRSLNDFKPHTTAALCGIGTATPTLIWRQPEIASRLESLWQLTEPQRLRWRRLVERTEIETKHSVIEPESVIDASTGERMKLFEQHAGDLAAAAAQQALNDARFDAGAITDLVVVTCTGFAAPGVDIEIMEQLGLRHDIQRTMVGFMGCFGALNAIRIGIDRCAADPDAVVLIVCVELCSLHLRRDLSIDNLIATALFGDGAAAVVVAGAESAHAIGLLQRGWSRVLPEGRDWMSWRITDNGFAMTLAPEVPHVLRRCIGELVHSDVKAGAHTFLVHPGGPEIITAVEQGIGYCDPIGIESARTVLRRCGNMSSATILFVLSEAMRRRCPLPACLLAFGPGLTVEAIRLMPCAPLSPTIP